jgi:glucokinase
VRLGVDIGGTKTDVVLVHAGAIVARHKTPSGFGADAVLAAASGAVDAVLADAGLEWSQIDSVGIGVPGGVTDGVVTYALNLGLERIDLAGLLLDAWGVRPAIDNDVNVAALGAWGLRARSASSLAYLNLGTGLAAGIILDGRLWRGARGTAGEIGHISVDPAGPLDADGLPGALESYASGSGFSRQWGVDGASAKDVLDAAAAGNPKAVAIRDGLYFGVASAIRALVLTLDVETIVLGGGLSAHGDALVDGTRHVIDEWSAQSSFLASLEMGKRIELHDPDLPVAALGAAALGATELDARMAGADG